MTTKKKVMPKAARGIYELWLLDKHGYKVLTKEEGRHVKAGLMVLQGELLLDNGALFLNGRKIAVKQGRRYEICYPLRPGAMKNALYASMRSAMKREGLL